MPSFQLPYLLSFVCIIMDILFSSYLFNCSFFFVLNTLHLLPVSTIAPLAVDLLHVPSTTCLCLLCQGLYLLWLLMWYKIMELLSHHQRSLLFPLHCPSVAKSHHFPFGEIYVIVVMHQNLQVTPSISATVWSFTLPMVTHTQKMRAFVQMFPMSVQLITTYYSCWTITYPPWYGQLVTFDSSDIYAPTTSLLGKGSPVPAG
jgi:hypothetical protein